MRNRIFGLCTGAILLLIVMRSVKSRPLLLPGAIAVGSCLGWLQPGAGRSLAALGDPLLFCLLVLIFYEIRFRPILKAGRSARFLLLAWGANFVIIPVIGWGIASLLFPRESPLFAGLLLYFLFPCTDWFLGFTRLAEGDVALGAVILPVNLISQLLLFPAYLGLICTGHAGPAAGGIQVALVEWFLFPLGVAAVLRLIHSFLLSARFTGGIRFSPGNIIPWVIGGVVVCLFADNIVILSANPFAFLKILLAVSLFFAASYLAGGLLARHFRLSRPQHVLLLMTTAARNAPLILGLTMVAVPDQPLIHAALIIGLLVEFPHLILLTRLLLRKVSNSSSAPPGSVTEMA